MRLAIGTRAGARIGNQPWAFGIGLLIVAEAVVLLLGLLVPVDALLRGWLVAFAIWSTVPLGSMTLLLIHSLTGGEWGVAAAPVLRPAAAMTAVTVLAFVPVLVALTHIYPWAADPALVPTDVARWYLNQLSFGIRAVIALGGWSVLGIVFAAGSGGRLLAGLGLAFFGLTISLVAVDWYLSLEPNYEATAFAAMIAIQQLLAALAIVAVIGPPAVDGKAAGDLGGLLIATLLGVVYFEFITFVIAWYGDLHDKAEWFLRRATLGWIAVLIVAIAFGAVVPFSMLLVHAIRHSRRGLRIAGMLILLGTVLHLAWVLVPAFDVQAGIVASAAATLALLTSVSLLIGPAIGPVLEARHAE